MSRQQVQAWFNLMVFLVALVAFAILVPVIGLAAANAAWAVLGLWGLGLLLFRRRGGGQVVWDERDTVVHSRALKVGFAASWVVFVLMAVALQIAFRQQRAVPVEFMPAMVVAAASVLVVTMSIATLVQMRNDG